MGEVEITLIVALAALAGGALIAATLAWCWRGWLDYKRAELAGGRPATEPSTTSRIEVADLRERVRRLEAIAAGVEL